MYPIMAQPLHMPGAAAEFRNFKVFNSPKFLFFLPVSGVLGPWVHSSSVSGVLGP